MRRCAICLGRLVTVGSESILRFCPDCHKSWWPQIVDVRVRGGWL